MRRHRTTARGVLLTLLAAAPAAYAPAAVGHPEPPNAAKVPRLIFPVVGPATYGDDFGDARGSGRHEGIDIVAPKRSVAVAAEAGTVKFHTTSSRAGCMLYLHGASGTTYLYVHLNNDRTAQNDNAGGCKPGIAYAPGLKSGRRVEAGEPLGYVGDSGDADGIAAHLHFEVHPGDGDAANPYAHLKKARKLLFAAKPGTTVALTLRGSVVGAPEGVLELKVDTLRRYPGGLAVPKVGRTVELAVPPDAVVFDPLGALLRATALARVRPGERAVVWTEPEPTTLELALGEPLALAADRIALGS